MKKQGVVYMKLYKNITIILVVLIFFAKKRIKIQKTIITCLINIGNFRFGKRKNVWFEDKSSKNPHFIEDFRFS